MILLLLLVLLIAGVVAPFGAAAVVWLALGRTEAPVLDHDRLLWTVRGAAAGRWTAGAVVWGLAVGLSAIAGLVAWTMLRYIDLQQQVIAPSEADAGWGPELVLLCALPTLIGLGLGLAGLVRARSHRWRLQADADGLVIQRMWSADRIAWRSLTHVGIVQRSLVLRAADETLSLPAEAAPAGALDEVAQWLESARISDPKPLIDPPPPALLQATRAAQSER